MKKIIIGADHGGFSLKEKIKSTLVKKGFLVKDVGTYSLKRCDYPYFAYLVASDVSRGVFQNGILICKSGIGNCIVANRLPGVRAALCHTIKAARLSRQHNDSNLLVLGSLFVDSALAKRIVAVWLKTKFKAGRHKIRLKQIEEVERKIRSQRLIKPFV
jgi:ribose 5-phosphate isomerase B